MGGSGRAGWRWLDLRLLSGDIVAKHPAWQGASVDRVVYCTARISGASNPSGARDQDTCLRALKQHNSVDLCEEGVYVNRVATAPIANRDAKGRPVLVTAGWPVMVQDAAGTAIPDAASWSPSPAARRRAPM